MKVTYTLQRGDTLYQIAHFYNTTVANLLALNPEINPYNLRVGEVIVIKEGEGGSSGADCKLVGDMRKVWNQHIYWAKSLLASITDRLKDTPDVSARLLQNPVDIVAVFSRYFPREANQKLTRLLTEHVEVCGTLYAAMRDGADIDELLRAWQVNADKIAALLVTFNPKYSYDVVKSMLDTHLEQAVEGASLRLKGDYLGEISLFNRAELDTAAMADYLAENLG